MNKSNIIAVVAISVTILLAINGWIFSAGKLSEKVAKVEETASEAKTKADYEHDINIKQTAILDNMLVKIGEDKEDIDKELDRIYNRMEER